MNFKELLLKLKKSNHNLLIMVGPPLSGKSTLIKKILENTKCEVISRDGIVEEFGGGLSYTEAFNTVDQKEVSKELNKRIKDQSLKENNVIIDMTNLSPKRRKGHLKSFPNHTKIAVIVNTPSYEKLLERNEIRNKEEGKFIPIPVIKSMFDSYKFPTKEEGFNHIVKV